jgi:hydroxymethylpyrimidine/phosphomethylpyrimidine kinase
MSLRRPCVLVFAGLDPSGGAGIQADIEAIDAMGAHALPIVTTLTVQDNDRVFAVHAVDAMIVRQQAQALMAKLSIAAIKIGIVGSDENAFAIADTIQTLRAQFPDLPVVLDPVLASGHGDALARVNAVQMLEPLRSLATLITPNLPEAVALCEGAITLEVQLAYLLRDAKHVLIKGGHGEGDEVVNRWFTGSKHRRWQWPRLPGEFHGSGCTLASAIAACLAQGQSMELALDTAQAYTQHSLDQAYAIADGQLIPSRTQERT